LRFDYPNDSSGKLVGTINSLKTNDNMIFRMLADKSNQSIHVNGQLYMTKANIAVIGQINSKIAISIYFPQSNLFCNCNIGEIIVFDRALNSREIEDIEQYLAKKWNIKI